MRSIALALLLLLATAHVWAQSRSYGSSSFRPSGSSSYGGASRSYGSSSFRSSSPSSSPASRSYSPSSSSSRTYTPSPSSNRSPLKSAGTSTSRTYTPSSVSGPSQSTTYTAPRYEYVSAHSYHPAFVNHYYYDSYGPGGMPWWAWFAIYNNNPAPQPGIAYANYGTPVNGVAVFLWIVVLACAVAGVVCWLRRRDAVGS